jgi:hypothetical protein
LLYYIIHLIEILYFDDKISYKEKKKAYA